MPIADVKNLKTWFPLTGGVFSKITGYVKAVNGVSLTVDKKEIISIVGESGCGKSTLGLSLLGLVKPREGSLQLDGNTIDIRYQKSWDPYRRKFQIIFQDPFTSLNPRHTVHHILAESLLLHKICGKNEIQSRIAGLLERVGLSADYSKRFPHAFSGGQRQRIAIARSIAVEPDMIVCDEVVSALDVSVQAQIIQMLMELKESMNLSLLFIAHDLSLVKAISDRVYVMYLGKIVESAETLDLFSKPRHPYTAALLNSIPTLNRKKKPQILGGDVPSPVAVPRGCVFQGRCPYVKDICKEIHPEMKTVEQSDVACYFPLP